MKWGKLLLGVGWACVLYACSDDDGKDDTIMNMSELTGKYWYYNAWLGDKYGMGQSDLLEVIRFEKGGVLKMMELDGGYMLSVPGQVEIIRLRWIWTMGTL